MTRSPLRTCIAGITWAIIWLGMGGDWASAVENWPEFRGPSGDGQAADSQLPVHFSETEHVRWKTPIHGRGWSSPVIWGDQIWLTTATEDGRQMSAIAVNRLTGAVEHDVVLFENDKPAFCHPTNSYASPTPAITAGRLFAHFGSYGTACLDTTNGHVLWKRTDLPCDHFRGPASSPILDDGKLYVAFDGFDFQYVVALDQQTGATVWRADRQIDYQSTDGDVKKAYCTCQIIQHRGQRQLVSPSAAETMAYDPADGHVLWRVHHGGMNTATRPLYGHGLVFITVGDGVGATKPALLAVRPDAEAELNGQPRLAWSIDQTPPKRPSPLMVGDRLFTISDEGVAMCLECATGKLLWRKRIAGNYRASPICANNKIYFANLEGEVTVIEAADEFREIAVNHFENGFQSSPAARGNSLILRSTSHLYCLEE